jgi:phosphatidylglycerophosphatase A
LSRLIAGGGGIGFAPAAPGTVASLAAVLLGAAMLWVSPWVVVMAAILTIVGGFLTLHQAQVEGDPGWVVIDEFAGQWLALAGLPDPSPLGLLAGFILFRVLDITKPGPVGWADRQHGVFGIMMDDVVAGALAAALLWLARLVWLTVGS